jgi:hypothetical protein
LFKGLCTLVIVFNGAMASVAANYEIQHVNSPDLKWMSGVELFFLIFYVMELVLKLVVHRGYFFINDEASWNNFDSTLVLLGIYDFIMSRLNLDAHSNLTFARLGRLLKLSRLLRIFRAVRFFAALRQMLTSIMQSMAMMFWAMVVLVLLWWTLGLVLLQGFSALLREDDMDDDTRAAIHDRFGSIPRVIFTFFSISTGGDDWENTYQLVVLAGELYAYMVLLYICFFQISLVNILAGIVVDHVITNAQFDDNDRLMRYREKKLQQGAELKKLFAKIDTDGSGSVTEDEMIEAMQDHEILAMMEENEVDPRDAHTFYELLCSASMERTVNAGQFIDGLMQMRGNAAGIDVQILRCQVDHLVQGMNESNKVVAKELLAVNRRLDKSISSPLVAQTSHVDSGTLQLRQIVEDGFHELRDAILAVTGIVSLSLSREGRINASL